MYLLVLFQTETRLSLKDIEESTFKKPNDENCNAREVKRVCKYFIPYKSMRLVKDVNAPKSPHCHNIVNESAHAHITFGNTFWYKMMALTCLTRSLLRHVSPFSRRTQNFPPAPHYINVVDTWMQTWKLLIIILIKYLAYLSLTYSTRWRACKINHSIILIKIPIFVHAYASPGVVSRCACTET